ncbi:MAG: EscU/YscU/HrcU family type III secretion system export apparatus switch protein [Myxococcota bacterium]
MAEDASAEDKKFDPTAKRIKEFRDQGRVALSKDLASTIQLGAVIVAFLVVGNAILAGLSGSLTWIIDHVGDDGGRGLTVGAAVEAELGALLPPTIVLSAILLLATLVAYFAQTGLLFSSQAIAFKLDRLNPLKRLADLFNPKQGAIRVLLTVGKLGLATMSVSIILAQAMPGIAALALAPVDASGNMLRHELWHLLMVTLLLLAVVAAIDYLWQRRRLAGEMRMTREEIQRETEEDEGKPQVKQRRRQKHRDLMSNRILKEVPLADVVVTNPTHFAVAISYKPGKHRAPVVVAKGADEMAAHVRAVARRHAVPIVEHRALARALFRGVKVGQAIPSSLFQMVAEVLAKVFRARRGGGRSAGAR